MTRDHVRIASSLLIWGALCAFLANACACSSTAGQMAQTARATVVDCTTQEAARMIDEFTPTVSQVILSARDSSGSINWTSVKDSFKSFGASTGACVVANLLAQTLSGIHLVAAQVNPTELKAAFEELRASSWGGATYKTEAGTL